GLAPLLMLPMLRARITETRRFTEHQAAESATHRPAHGFSGWLQPLVRLASAYPGRAVGIAVVGGLMAVGESAVFQFTSYFVQNVHGWSPGDFSLMFIVGGGVGIIGNVVAGRLGDRIGRRTIGFVFLALFPLFSWMFYHGPGWSLPLSWTLFVFCNTAGGVVVRALSTELFPTSYRGTSAAWLSLVQSLGWAAGLALVSLGVSLGSDIARTTSLIALVVLIAALALLTLPETFRQELEEISHDDDATALAAPVRSDTASR
ncbi:MAG TPA: MFS transporter, partial [Rhizomicrobium sp.]